VPSFSVISFSYKNLPLSAIGTLSFPPERNAEVLLHSKDILNCNEVFCISTCNRTEWVLADAEPTPEKVNQLLDALFQPGDKKDMLLNGAEILHDDCAVHHVFRLCSSLESMVIGEREILAQVRKAFEFAFENGYASDKLRILMRFATECAKDVFTRTRISEKPVSVASLAYRELVQRGMAENKTFLVIGAGETNWKLLDYLKKSGTNSFHIFNRTYLKARELAARVSGVAYTLDELNQFSIPFDAILICTSSPDPLINEQNSEHLFRLFKFKPLVADLSVPKGIDNETLNRFKPDCIFVENLNEQVNKNLKEREKEISACEEIIAHYINIHSHAQKERAVELMFGEIPRQIRNTKEKAISEVFGKEIEGMDEKSKDILFRVLDYMEKKYNTFTMCSAKEILLGKDYDRYRS
jgi:glutamyl-tRNA reductase